VRASWFGLCLFGLALTLVLFSGCAPSTGGNGGDGGGGDGGNGGNGGNGGGDGAATTSLVFIHHSVGQDWLDNGLRDALAAKTYIDEVNDITYGTDVAPDAGRPDTLAEVPGELTDIPHWVFWFNDYIDHVKDYHNAAAAGVRQAGANRIVMFKSCFPNSDIWGDGEEPGDPFTGDFNLADFRAVYRNQRGIGIAYTHEAYTYHALQDAFANEPETLFVVCTPPPNVAYGDASNGARGREFADWLAGEWLDGYNAAHPSLHNVVVFNVFDVLANPDDGSAEANLLQDGYVRDPGDSHPSPAGDAALTTAFVTGAGSPLDAAWTEFTAE